MIAELLIGTIVAISCGGLVYLATRPKKKEEVQPEAPYKVEPPVLEEVVQPSDYLSSIAFAEGEYEAAVTAADVQPKVETLADYVAEVSVQESVQVEQPAVEEAPTKKKRKYTRKAKPAAKGGK